MSCEGQRGRFVAVMAAEPAVCQALGGDAERAAQILETLYDTASQRQEVAPALADALTRVLFGQMRAQGLTPPTHAADGLPKVAARQGYAALAQTLLAIRGGRALPPLAQQIAQASAHPARAPDGQVAELESYWAGRRGPEVVSITIDGCPYYVSGGDFASMKAAVRAYASATRSPLYGWDAGAKRWRVPGTLSEVAAALAAYRITAKKPTPANPSPPTATEISAPDDDDLITHDDTLISDDDAEGVGDAEHDEAEPEAEVAPEAEAAPEAAAPSHYRMPPSAPPGAVPPAVLRFLRAEVRGLTPPRKAALLALANAQAVPLSEEGALRTMLRSTARQLRATYDKQRTSLPLVYWARQYSDSPPKRHALAVAILSALRQPRCPLCGQFTPAATARRPHVCPPRTFGADGYNGLGIDRYGVTRLGTRPDGTPIPKRRTVFDAAKDFIVASDPITNPAMAELWGRIASGIAGHDCRVVLRAGGFATDMAGTIYADPYPLGQDADPRHNLLVTKAGIYHEIGHELTTPPEDWAYVLAVASGEQTVPGIEQGRTMITHIYNIVEDGRMERDMSDRFPGVAETLAAQCAIYPRWQERVGPEVPLGEEVIWPLLYTALPYFTVRDEVRAAMTPEGRALFEELEPIARRGVLGTPSDSLAAAIAITQRLQAAGVLEVPPTSATPPPAPPPGTPPRAGPPSSDAGGSERSPGAKRETDDQAGDAGEQGDAGEAGDTDQQGDAGARSGAASPAVDAGTDTGSAAGSDAARASDRATPGKVDPNAAATDTRPLGAGAAPARPTVHDPATHPHDPITPDRLDDLLNDLEAQAVSSLDREVARQGRYAALGGLLHAPLRGSTERLWDEGYRKQPPPDDTTRQRYRTPDGAVVAVQTGTPTQTDPRVLAGLERRRPAQQEIAGRLARRLESIRQETIARLRMQSEGRIDRRRLPAALAERVDVRTRLSSSDDTGMAVSLLLDQSGSMQTHISSRQLYDATCIMGQALEQLAIPYEVRGHGGASTQYKAIDDPTLDPARGARLAEDETSSNFVTAPVVGLATAALLAREDANRLIVNLMDGDMEDHDATVTQYQETRQQGIVTFGVYLGRPSEEQQRKLSALFGTNNWRPIAALTELPQVVGQRIADIFETLGADT